MWRVTVALFDWNGKLLGTFVPYASNADPMLQIRQMEASRDPKKALKIAKVIISAKFERMGEAAREWGGEDDYEGIQARHPLAKVRTVAEARGAESVVTEAYWAVFREELKRRWPETKFKIRGHQNHGYKMKAVEPVNAALNYAYSILEAKARTNIARVGLSTYFGFLHSTLPGKEPLVYDLQEFERTEMDRAVLEVLSAHAIQRDGFLRLSDWTARLSRIATRAVAEAASGRFESPVPGGSLEGRFYRETLALRSALLVN